MSLKQYPMSDGDLKRLEIGYRAKVLLDLHLEDPKGYPAEFILNSLFKEYEKQGFDLEEQAD